MRSDSQRRRRACKWALGLTKSQARRLRDYCLTKLILTSEFFRNPLSDTVFPVLPFVKIYLVRHYLSELALQGISLYESAASHKIVVSHK